MSSKYTEQIVALAQAEGLHLNRLKIEKVLSKYQERDIVRMLDAFERFGVKAILENITN